MSTYVVGDLQGCLSPLLELLDSIHFDSKKDILWCTGDIVNRGPESLATLRFIKNLGAACITVLGNHDLHLLAVAYSKAPQKKLDTLDDILNAPDADELLNWLRHQPLIHHEHGFTLVHAGLAPQWSISTALELSKEVEGALQSDDFSTFLIQMYGNTPSLWDESLEGIDRLRCIVNYCTRMRFCYGDGELDLNNKKSPEHALPNTKPWFTIRNRINANDNIVFGHWATLACNSLNTPHIYPLDSGCIWGNELTMLRLDDLRYFKSQRFDKAHAK